MGITIFRCHLSFEVIGEYELIYWQGCRDLDDGLHCFTEQKWFIPSLLPVLIENRIALWFQSLPGKMKDTVAVYKVKGGPCIYPTNIYQAPVSCLDCHRHWGDPMHKAGEFPGFP